MMAPNIKISYFSIKRTEDPHQPTRTRKFKKDKYENKIIYIT